MLWPLERRHVTDEISQGYEIKNGVALNSDGKDHWKNRW